MEDCHIDIEVFSRNNLKKCGVNRNSEDPSTEILVLCFAFGNGPVSTWVPIDELPTGLVAEMRKLHDDEGGEFIVGTQVPFEIVYHAENGGSFRAHNSQYERTQLNGPPGQRINFPPTTLEQWVCTAAKAAVFGLPRDLKRLAQTLDAKHQKDEIGRATMLQVTKPRKPSKDIPEDRWTPWNSPERFYVLYSYCIDDVRTERCCDHIVPDITKKERKLFLLDQVMNDRGVKVDIEATKNAIEIRDQYKKVLNDQCVEACGFRATQTMKMSEWIRKDCGYPLANLQADTIRDVLNDPSMPGKVKKVLRLRSLHEMKAPAKYDAIMRAVCSDGRIRGSFLFYGAGTGRWSSLIVQLQNLFRSIISDPETAVEAMEILDIPWLQFLYEEDLMRILASCVRSMLIAETGYDLLCLDYSSIEGRIVAWLANQEDKLEIFRTHGKVYEYTGARMYQLPTDIEFLMTMKKTHPAERFSGKTGELACGFQGGWRAFTKMAKKYGIDIDEMRGRDLVTDWRGANQKIVEMWYDIQDHFAAAISNPGTVYSTNKLMFKVVGDWLYMRLPSGRRLAYYKPEIDNNGDPTYMGINTVTRQYGRVDTYGGRIVQNAAEGISRDVLASGITKLEPAGYPIIGLVHDEAIMEVPEGFGSTEEAAELMCDMDDWAEGLPVTADGFRAKRYRKDG